MRQATGGEGKGDGGKVSSTVHEASGKARVSQNRRCSRSRPQRGRLLEKIRVCCFWWIIIERARRE